VEKRASRTHCRFVPCGKGWRVVDNQSSNGTWLGGRPVVSARLQPGDEVEIGHTVISFHGRVEETPKATRKRPRRKVPWGALVVPVVLFGGSWAALGAIRGKAEDEAETDWTRTAHAVVARADLAPTPDERLRILGELRRELRNKVGTTPAMRLADAAKSRARKDAAPDAPPKSGWEMALSEYRAESLGMTPSERFQRLARLLGRYARSAEAARAFGKLLTEEEALLDGRAQEDRASVHAQATAAFEEGRLGQAIDLWNGWLLRAPPLTQREEVELAETLELILDQARDQAEAALARYEQLVEDGRTEEARKVADAAIERLRGTGWESWVGGLTRKEDDPGSTVTTSLGRRPTESTSTRDRTLAIHAITSAEDLTRLRRFSDAAARLETASKGISDRQLRNELTTRAADLRDEGNVLAKVLGQVRERPQSFARFDMDGASWRAEGATEDALLLAKGRSKKVEQHALGTVSGAAFTALLAKAELGQDDYVPAALLLRDVDELGGYTHWMRQALVVDALQQHASAVHARLLGKETPDGGYVPHPTDPGWSTSWRARARPSPSPRCGPPTPSSRRRATTRSSSSSTPRSTSIRTRTGWRSTRRCRTR
jgi:pSer/pThr/pTyr-binding forkhead associated (FHA) protein